MLLFFLVLNTFFLFFFCVCGLLGFLCVCFNKISLNCSFWIVFLIIFLVFFLGQLREMVVFCH